MRISNQRALKIILCAELVPKSFSINVAIPMAAANNNRYKPEADVEKITAFTFLRKGKNFMKRLS